MDTQMKLSKNELSNCLGVAPKTIDRWLKQGKLPILKKDSGFTFSRKELSKWASRHHIQLNLLDPENHQKQEEQPVNLSDAVQNAGVFHDIPGQDTKTVFHECLKQLPTISKDFRVDLIDRLIERENAHSTGLGNGIAIPHPREPLTYLKNPMVSVCFLKDPIEYNAIDHQPVFVLFFLLSPSLTVHLNLLSALSFCLRDNNFLTCLKSSPDTDSLVRQIEMLQQKNPHV
jgi:PTS system nitrogen regulatory IIA component